MQRFATGPLGWSPRQFWQSTWQEVQMALEGQSGKRLADVITPERAAEIASHYPPTPSIRKHRS